MKRFVRSFISIVIMILCTACYEKELVCESGYDLIDGVCVIEDVIFANYKINYYCNKSSYNEQLEGTECVWYVSTPALYSSTCPNYYTDYGSRCRFLYGTKSPYCRYDEVLWGEYCYPEYTLPSSSGYYCSIGNLVGTQCVQKYSYNAFMEYEYYCPSGYLLNGTICTKTIYKNPIEK